MHTIKEHKRKAASNKLPKSQRMVATLLTLHAGLDATSDANAVPEEQPSKEPIQLWVRDAVSAPPRIRPGPVATLSQVCDTRGDGREHLPWAPREAPAVSSLLDDMIPSGSQTVTSNDIIPKPQRHFVIDIPEVTVMETSTHDCYASSSTNTFDSPLNGSHRDMSAPNTLALNESPNADTSSERPGWDAISAPDCGHHSRQTTSVDESNLEIPSFPSGGGLSTSLAGYQYVIVPKVITL
ncbi:hypothetical protein VNI00_017046 [Paramarasmius palmivorus]|uniref:Uncharacterized protein n=1 Tax=Paramarasmius palmivorus TaxID=297713 RepID=A0AAW0B8S1_9AGAR